MCKRTRLQQLSEDAQRLAPKQWDGTQAKRIRKPPQRLTYDRNGRSGTYSIKSSCVVNKKRHTNRPPPPLCLVNLYTDVFSQILFFFDFIEGWELRRICSKFRKEVLRQISKLQLVDVNPANVTILVKYCKDIREMCFCDALPPVDALLRLIACNRKMQFVDLYRVRNSNYLSLMAACPSTTRFALYESEPEGMDLRPLVESYGHKFARFATGNIRYLRNFKFNVLTELSSESIGLQDLLSLNQASFPNIRKLHINFVDPDVLSPSEVIFMQSMFKTVENLFLVVDNCREEALVNLLSVFLCVSEMEFIAVVRDGEFENVMKDLYFRGLKFHSLTHLTWHEGNQSRLSAVRHLARVSPKLKQLQFLGDRLPSDKWDKLTVNVDCFLDPKWLPKLETLQLGWECDELLEKIRKVRKGCDVTKSDYVIGE